MTIPSERTLARWLRTGRPHSVERHLDDPRVIEILDRLTVIDDEVADGLATLTAAPAAVTERAIDDVRRRADRADLAALVDLVGLGWHTGRAVAGGARRDRDDEPHQPPRPPDEVG